MMWQKLRKKVIPRTSWEHLTTSVCGWSTVISKPAIEMLNVDDQPLVCAQRQHNYSSGVILWCTFVLKRNHKNNPKCLLNIWKGKLHTQCQHAHVVLVILMFALIPSVGIMLLQWLTGEASKAIQHTNTKRENTVHAVIALTQRLQHYRLQCYKLLCLLLECLKQINEQF